MNLKEKINFDVVYDKNAYFFFTSSRDFAINGRAVTEDTVNKFSLSSSSASLGAVGGYCNASVRTRGISGSITNDAGRFGESHVGSDFCCSMLMGADCIDTNEPTLHSANNDLIVGICVIGISKSGI